VELLAVAIFVLVLLQPVLQPFFDHDALQMWSTIFLAITVQATPFLALGVAVSGAIAAFLPPGWVARMLPDRPGLAVPAASCAGLALPGCECGSVPIAGRLVNRGASAAPALAFMLAAPAINPIVLVATAVAFPGMPEVVAARFLASLATAVGVGYIWARIGTERDLERVRSRLVDEGTRGRTFTSSVSHDFLTAGGFLVVGAAIAASMQVFVPMSVLYTIGGSEALAVLTMATLAILLSICSEADAFVAASLPQFSLSSRLVFLVVGPVVDLKLVALQVGVFGRRFATRFVPVSLAVSLAAALVAGWWLL
jgi:uncharacterized protein